MAFLQLSIGEGVTLIAMAALLAVDVVVILRTLEGSWFAKACGHLHRCRASVRRPCSDLDTAVHSRMLETRVSNFRLLSQVLVCVFPLSCGGITADFLRVGRLVDWPVVAVCLASVSLTLLMRVAPGLVRPKTLRLWQCTYFAAACAFVSPGICPQGRLSSMSRIAGLLLTASNCSLLHIPTAMVQHLLFAVVLTVSLSFSPLHAEELTHHFFAEMNAAAFSCTCVAVMQHLAEVQHRSNLETAYLAEKHLAHDKLLGVFYDVVIEVDSDTTIVSSEPDLAPFLPHHAGYSLPTILGTKLDDLLPCEQDRQLFVEHTQGPWIGGDKASVSVLHLRMGHDCECSLDVELFSHRFGLMSQRHLLGVRALEEDDLRRDVQSMMLRVDPSDEDLIILDISPSLQHELGGAAPGDSLRRFTSNVEDLKARLQIGFNTVASEDCAEASYSFKAMLQPEGQRTRVLADCCLTLETCEDIKDASQGTRLCFTNLTPLRRSSVHGARGSSRVGKLRGTPRDTRSQQLVPVTKVTSIGSTLQRL